MNGQQAQQLEKMVDGDNVMEIGFKRLSENAVLPTKANPTDSGLDIFAAEDVIIAPGETKVIPTDLAVELPSGYEAVVRPRSGITSKTKLRVQLGTIDESYRGNIGVIVDNIYEETSALLDYYELINGETQEVGKYAEIEVGTYLIRKGDKIAQLVVQPIPQTVAVEITELSEGERGDNAYGSSGVR